MNAYETPAAWEGHYQGERAVFLRFGPYEAIMLPEIGGNLIAFRDLERGYRILHEPRLDEMAAFIDRPMIHGIPVLFPPNRYDRGQFAWDGQCLQLPVNEEATGNHLHGFLYDTPWVVDEYGHSEQESYVSVSVKVDRSHQVYAQFPFEFSITLRYSLSGDGVLQHVRVRNHGNSSMPTCFSYVD